ncbi:MAG: DUF4249 domain-containing protein [Bacteroidales bacterium]|nr:DUF4249 domain-containing protein [Bacteroidales bacterium]
MKYLVYSILTVTLLILSSCVEEFDIMVDNRYEMIVIDAMVTDLDTVQTVYICREREKLDYDIKYPPIEGVSIHIEDDNGWNGEFKDISEDRGRNRGRIFAIKGHQFEPGRTYTITVLVGDREFKATETMIPLPDIRGLKFYSKETKDNDGCRYQPIIYFKDNQPNVDNYYLFSRRFDVIRSEEATRYAPLQRLSDVGFRDNLDGIALSVGYGAEPQFTFDLQMDSYYYFTFMTISKSNYNYYGVMEDNINNDGGIYKPTPTSPVTNFIGENVQGQFIAASRLNIHGQVTLDNIIDR